MISQKRFEELVKLAERAKKEGVNVHSRGNQPSRA